MSLVVPAAQNELIMTELGLNKGELSKMQSFLKLIINQPSSSDLKTNIVTLIEKKNAYTNAISGIIDATKNDIARLSGAVLNSALSIPLDLVKLECIQDTLAEIQEKLADMPVEDLYKVYTSSSPPAIAIAGVKTQIDDAINDFLNDQCKENIPKLTAVIDTAYDVAKKASAAIDSIAAGGEEETNQRDDPLDHAEIKKAYDKGHNVGGGAKYYTRKPRRRRSRTRSRRYNNLQGGSLKIPAPVSRTTAYDFNAIGLSHIDKTTQQTYKKDKKDKNNKNNKNNENNENNENSYKGGTKSYTRKPRRRRSRKRTRRRKTRRNSKKPRRRTIRRKKRHKLRTR